MMANSMEQNDWKVPPDNTVQVVDPMGMNEEADGPKRNWTGILISLGIITFVLLMVTIATLLVGEPPPTFYGRRLVITDLKNPAFVAAAMGTQWVTGEQLAYVSEKKGIRMLNVNTNVNITLVTNIALHQTGAAAFSVSPDMRYVLLVHDVIKGRLFTSTAEYSVYDVMTDPVTLTSDATPDILYNGVPDLLYEGKVGGIEDVWMWVYGVWCVGAEILGQGHAVWPCPSGDYIAAVSINNTGVRELPVLVYADNVYPTVQTLRYPTVSTPIPQAWLWIYDLQSKQVPPPRTRLIPPEPIEE
nr:inactive dipeptidyl peptidase 10-like [Penaeus vannamei]